jgi:hypothetical protein
MIFKKGRAHQNSLENGNYVFMNIIDLTLETIHHET